MERLKVGDIVTTPGNDGWWGTRRQVETITHWGYRFLVLEGGGYIGAESPCSFRAMRVGT